MNENPFRKPQLSQRYQEGEQPAGRSVRQPVNIIVSEMLILVIGFVLVALGWWSQLCGFTFAAAIVFILGGYVLGRRRNSGFQEDNYTPFPIH
jgi:uncharacterized membrane protein